MENGRANSGKYLLEELSEDNIQDREGGVNVGDCNWLKLSLKRQNQGKGKGDMMN